MSSIAMPTFAFYSALGGGLNAGDLREIITNGSAFQKAYFNAMIYAVQRSRKKGLCPEGMNKQVAQSRQKELADFLPKLLNQLERGERFSSPPTSIGFLVNLTDFAFIFKADVTPLLLAAYLVGIPDIGIFHSERQLLNYILERSSLSKLAVILEMFPDLELEHTSSLGQFIAHNIGLPALWGMLDQLEQRHWKPRERYARFQHQVLSEVISNIKRYGTSLGPLKECLDHYQPSVYDVWREVLSGFCDSDETIREMVFFVLDHFAGQYDLTELFYETAQSGKKQYLFPLMEREISPLNRLRFLQFIVRSSEETIRLLADAVDKGHISVDDSFTPQDVDLYFIDDVRNLKNKLANEYGIPEENALRRMVQEINESFGPETPRSEPNYEEYYTDLEDDYEDDNRSERCRGG